jgi:ABC-type uncharacterized transport system substrate-binding protein
VLQRTRTIPIVFINVGDPVAGGLVKSIARPEGNTTGITSIYQSMGGKCRIKTMLRNETYAGIRYFNRITAATEAAREGKKVVRGKWALREPAECIRSMCPPSYPAISSSAL